MVFSTMFSSTLNLAISSTTNSSRRRVSNTSSTRGVNSMRIRASSTEKGESKEKDQDDKFNPFGFVTDNPSSRSAIQLPETPADDGNVGQMIDRIQDKGKEYGSYVKSGKLRWFVRETGSAKSRRGTILFLHGAPTQSFSYRVVMSQLSDAGFHCYAPDWIGFGFSDKPQPGYGFNYTENEFHDALDKLLEVLGVESPFFLVVQNAIIAERFIEAGSPYVLKNEKADVYRLPYLASSGPGFDKYLPQSVAEEFQNGNPQNIKLKLIEGAGHMPQEDWPEKVIDALRMFF
ncbi:hypothetical protein TSUD_259400 [Trifolium subterraneum]|uniref:AB hydrolase-1 domain-containing protein n=1 Tax=Trifolium subterraneum TaxID=3900 RepID=A0A2Z6NN62_TRISU|nr:hypothetical protein TSUD_259400 [Trifolium subterraneum]